MGSSPPVDEASLLEAALRELQRRRRGHPTPAFDRLYHYLRPTLAGAIGRAYLVHGRWRSDLEQTEFVADVLQRVVLEMLRHDARFLRNWDPDVASLRTWVSQLARRRTLDALRRQPRVSVDHRRLLLVDPASSPEARALDRDEWRRLEGFVLDEMPARAKEIYERRFIEDQSVSEIATALQMTVGAVYQAVKNIRNRFRTRRRELDPLEPS